MLAVRDLVVRFDDTTVLDGVSLEVGDQEIVALLGPSGCGKSTLLRVVAGLLPPDAGTVTLAGVDVTSVPAHRRGIGLVFQDQQLFPHLDVAANIAFGLRMAGADRRTAEGRVAELLDLVGLSGFHARRTDTLSGGEATRVALARSLAPRPRVLLLDEPLTGLDRELHDRLVADVRAILHASRTTALWVTHDRDEADAIAQRIVHLTPPGRQGRPA